MTDYRADQPESEVVGLSDEEVLDLADDCGLEKQEITTWDGESRTVDHGWECTDAQLVTFATALIARYARPTTEPVPMTERLPELRGMFERILCVARSSGGLTVGNIQLAGRLIDAVVSWSGDALPVPGAEVGS